jgi:DNA end-binding protein Ku
MREAMRESGRIGIAKIILREAQHLAAVEAIGNALVLTMMRFADELADLEDFTFPASNGIRPAELKMARQLISNLDAGWEPEKYTDEYTNNLMRVIKAKMKGREPKLEARETPHKADVIDLMARLRASLEGKKAPAAKGAKSSGRKTRAASAKKKTRTAARKADGRRRRAA